MANFNNVQLYCYLFPQLFSFSSFSFTKHLWICNDVYMHFSSHTECFGLSKHCKHLNKKGDLATDSRSSNEHLELNQPQWDQLHNARNTIYPI